MTKNEQYEEALSLLDFCGNDLTIENAAKYFQLHTKGFKTEEQRNAIFLTALSLLRNA